MRPLQAPMGSIPEAPLRRHPAAMPLAMPVLRLCRIRLEDLPVAVARDTAEGGIGCNGDRALR